MDEKSYPVTLDELKKNMRLPENDDSNDYPLSTALSAAHEYIERFTGLDFEEEFKDKDFPYLLRYAILITAGSFFKTPTDSIFTIPTKAQALANTYKDAYKSWRQV